MAELDGPALRSILWSILDDYTDLATAETDLREELARKQAAFDAAQSRVKVVTQQAAEMRRGAVRSGTCCCCVGRDLHVVGACRASLSLACMEDGGGEEGMHARCVAGTKHPSA